MWGPTEGAWVPAVAHYSAPTAIFLHLSIRKAETGVFMNDESEHFHMQNIEGYEYTTCKSTEILGLSPGRWNLGAYINSTTK